MLNNILKLIAQILEIHNLKTKAVHFSEHPQEIILLFNPDSNTNPLTKFLDKCQIPHTLDADPELKSLCIYF